MELLCLDGGSSSLKYAVYRHVEGAFERLAAGAEPAGGDVAADLARALGAMAGGGATAMAGGGATAAGGGPMGSGGGARGIEAIGHRVVFGGPDYVDPTPVDDGVLADLERLVPLEPLHLRAELDLIYAAKRRFPEVPQVLCFDTAFHRASPDIAKRLPLPPDIDPLLQRYGFHGLSYEYIASQADVTGRAVVAHLGSGASLCALDRGRPLDTTMGFSALGGLMMGTRPGDLDPGVILQLLHADGFDAASLSDLLYRRSGLLGVSGTTADMRALVAAAPADPRAAAAVELFVYQLCKHVGAMAAVLGGLDTLVFTGGIGEGAPTIRAAACSRLEHLGVRIDAAANARGERTISDGQGHVRVLVVPTDENLMIARHVVEVMRR